MEYDHCYKCKLHGEVINVPLVGVIQMKSGLYIYMCTYAQVYHLPTLRGKIAWELKFFIIYIECETSWTHYIQSLIQTDQK